MDAAGEGGSQKGRNSGKRPAARKRKARTPSSTSVPQLIQKLRDLVFPEPDTKATRKEVLQQAKQYILQLESTLDSLLKMKADIFLEHSAPYTLEDVREEFLQLVSSEEGGPTADPVDIDNIDPVLLYMQPEIQEDLDETVEELKIENTGEPFSSPELMEFEKYLRFYKQTVDLLVESRVVSQAQVTLPVVSKAISNLWQELLQSGKTNNYQNYFSQDRTAASCSFSSPDTSCPNGRIRDSGAESQEATSSFLSSTPEDILLDDAFELAAVFLDQGANRMTSSPGPTPDVSLWSSPQGEEQLHQYVSDFLRRKFSLCPQASAPQYDYETLMLRCTENFDDLDDL
ncbi:stimulated by retinoic acid gene 8 protein homolog isoform X2 [Ranitomeya variabilis]|uniref:stimulated by retinoic acid gene 8 protein homolog isoform X2 n=1 Tax=Ranitomeya variabilis TaxID=490064 RepID=UPI004056548E